MNVGELRKALEGVPDDLPVGIELDLSDLDAPDVTPDLWGADLETATVEARCDEVDRLYLFARIEEVF